ncbi:MAG: hypothetical protein NT046_05720, partial [Arenimonas sp.]|nr:hypothetical protein [Arenimonas sp.]
MKLNSGLKVGGKQYAAGDRAPMKFIYPFFLFHMAMFGLSGFFMAYGSGEVDLAFLYMHGGIAITVYMLFYLAIFGVDEVKWMLINAGLGLLGIWAEINYILGWFGTSRGDFSPWVHVTPFLYYVLYTFLLRQLLLDLTGSRDKPARKRLVETLYVVASVTL